jgi:methanogenic corrinoid protein MtbC1
MGLFSHVVEHSAAFVLDKPPTSATIVAQFAKVKDLSKTKQGNSRFPIAAVERDVGLSKDVLRVWERRYGFPSPERSPTGDRVYSLEQVDHLRLVKRLMDQGHRPGQLLTRSVAQLRALEGAQPRSQHADSPGGEDFDKLLSHVTGRDNDALVQSLQQRLARDGLARFVQDTAAPLSARVGAAWQEGRLQIYEEHRFTEAMTRVLRQALAGVPPGRAPRVLLTSVPNEPHALGLLMAEAMLALEGAYCLSLGTQTPLPDIVRGADAHRADVVALSFSAAFPRRRIPGLLTELRQALPSRTGLWAGGAGVSRVSEPPGVELTGTWPDALAALARWQGNR